MTGTSTSDPEGSGRVGTVDSSHLLLVGAGPGLGLAVARRFRGRRFPSHGRPWQAEVSLYRQPVTVEFRRLDRNELSRGRRDRP